MVHGAVSAEMLTYALVNIGLIGYQVHLGVQLCFHNSLDSIRGHISDVEKTLLT